MDRRTKIVATIGPASRDREVLVRMVVTEGAVEKHVSNIFGKLGLPPSEADHRRVLAVLAFLRG